MTRAEPSNWERLELRAFGSEFGPKDRRFRKVCVSSVFGESLLFLTCEDRTLTVNNHME